MPAEPSVRSRIAPWHRRSRPPGAAFELLEHLGPVDARAGTQRTDPQPTNRRRTEPQRTEPQRTEPQRTGPQGTGPILQAAAVLVRFGGVTALDTVDLQVPRGQISGLIGPNGAGKTTMFNVLCGLLAPSSGQVLLDGSDITCWPPHRRGRAGIARTFQRLELFSAMTVRDNLVAAWESSHRWAIVGRGSAERRRRVADVVEALGLDHLLDRRAGELPTGQGRMVELGRALCSDPKVILLDEPGSGLDAKETARFREVLRSVVRAEGPAPAVLLVEHDMSLVMEVCEQVTVLDFGKRIAYGSADEVRSNPDVRAAYLGDSDVA